MAHPQSIILLRLQGMPKQQSTCKRILGTQTASKLPGYGADVDARGDRLARQLPSPMPWTSPQFHCSCSGQRQCGQSSQSRCPSWLVIPSVCEKIRLHWGLCSSNRRFGSLRGSCPGRLCRVVDPFEPGSKIPTRSEPADSSFLEILTTTSSILQRVSTKYNPWLISFCLSFALLSRIDVCATGRPFSSTNSGFRFHCIPSC